MCLTPDVKSLNLTLPYSVPIESINLTLDGVLEYAPLQNNGRISGLADAFIFYGDPMYYTFENGKLELEHEQRKFVMITVSWSSPVVPGIDGLVGWCTSS